MIGHGQPWEPGRGYRSEGIGWAFWLLLSPSHCKTCVHLMPARVGNSIFIPLLRQNYPP